jgi:hypothetical protein
VRKRAQDVFTDEQLGALEMWVIGQPENCPRIIPLHVDLYVAATAGVPNVTDCKFDLASDELVYTIKE